MSSKILFVCIFLLTFSTSSDLVPLKEIDRPDISPADSSKFKTADSSKFPNERILSETENAYNPIPSPDGKTIAYVETGWNRYDNVGGLGRGNLKSNIKLMDSDGKILTEQKLADAFLDGWTADGKNLIAYRDWVYSIVSIESDSLTKKYKVPNVSRFSEKNKHTTVSERFAYLEKENTLLWIQNEYQDFPDKKIKGRYSSTLVSSAIKTSQNNLPPFKDFIPDDLMFIPSPNERYIAMVGTEQSNNDLQIYDRDKQAWTNLGKIIIHPDKNWGYLQPSWNPWFADSSKLVFVSAAGIVIASPDDKDKKIVGTEWFNIGLPVPSPDGKLIAYVSFDPRPMQVRPDLKFYGGTTIWIIDSEGKNNPQAVTDKNEDETYGLRWLNNQQVVFDRIADEDLFKKARLWKADVLNEKSKFEK
jgi:WD40-like Beta Propeller Repeat